MGTSNFKYDNRCIVVTNEDYEDDNRPSLGECVDHDRNYPSYEVVFRNEEMRKKAESLNFLLVVFTSGYYEGGCIDFCANELDITDVFGYRLYCEIETKKELIEETLNHFGGYLNITRKEVDKAIGKVKGKALDDWYEDALSNIYELILSKEEKIANELCDYIKNEYGYEEYGCIGHFSNGEGLYQKIG